MIEFHELLCKLGFKVFLAPFNPNGKPLHVKGFLDQFRSVAEKNVKWLSQLSNYEIPIVGIDPSIVLTYRDEYLQILGKDHLDFKVFLPQEFSKDGLAWIQAYMKKHSKRVEYRIFSAQKKCLMK